MGLVLAGIVAHYYLGGASENDYVGLLYLMFGAPSLLLGEMIGGAIGAPMGSPFLYRHDPLVIMTIFSTFGCGKIGSWLVVDFLWAKRVCGNI